MAKESILQIRIDTELKNQVEELYKNLGTSFAEAVRIFAKQSLQERAMPFVVRESKPIYPGMLEEYANPELIEQEENAFAEMIIQKHGKNNN